MNVLIKLRNQARLNKDFELSDKIRDELKKNGISLNDGGDITTFTID